MDFDPEEFLGKSASSIQSKMGNSFDPDQYLKESVDEDAINEAAKNPDFVPDVHAAANPDQFEFARQVDLKRQNESILEGLKRAKPVEMVENAGIGLGRFLMGLPSLGKNLAQQGYYAATGDPRLDTKRAEVLLGAQQAEQGTKELIQGTLGKLEAAALRAGQLQSEDEMRQMSALAGENYEPKIKEIDEKFHLQDFARRVENAKTNLSLAEGRPVDTGLVAGGMKALSGGMSPAAAYSPESLEAQGAEPVDVGVSQNIAAFASPVNLAIAAAPGLPGAGYLGGAATKYLGKGLALPVNALETGVGKALAKKAISGKVVNALTGAGGGSLVTGLATAPIATGGALAGAAALKGLQKVGQAMEAQGGEMMTGIPSQYTARAALARVTGKSDLGAGIAMRTGNAIATGAASAAGFVPVNAALSEGDPNKFLESELGAAAFGGAFKTLEGSRRGIVEGIRPHLRSEGARTFDVNSEIGQKSLAYIQSLPEEQQHALFEVMGALQGFKTKGKGGGEGTSQFYPLPKDAYLAEVEKLTGSKAGDGGRGFFTDENGRAIVNADLGSSFDVSHTMGHEGGHAVVAILNAAGEKGGVIYDNLLNEARKGLIDKKSGLPTKEFREFIKSYNEAYGREELNADDPRAIEEFLAEQSGRVIAGEGFDFAVPQSLADKIRQGVGRFAMRSLGIDARKIGQTSLLNAEELGNVTQAMRDTLRQVAHMEKPEPPPRAGEEPPAAPSPTPISSPAQTQGGALRPQPMSPDQTSVAAALQKMGMKKAEAEERARNAQGVNAEEMLASALGRSPESTRKITSSIQSKMENAPTEQTGVLATPPEAPVARPGGDSGVLSELGGAIQRPEAPKAVTGQEISQRVTDAENVAVQTPEFGRARTPGKERIRREARVGALLKVADENAEGDMLRLHTDEDGNQSYKGRLDPENNEAHRMLLDELGVQKDGQATISLLDDQVGKTVFLDYRSAKKTAPEDISGEQRRQEQQASTAMDRRTGGEATEQKGKAFHILGFKVWPKEGSLTMFGFSPDKWVANIGKLIEHLKAQGVETGYKDVNDPEIMADAQRYAYNHSINAKGDGSAPIAGMELTGQPERIPQDRFQLLNAALNFDISTKGGSKREGTKRGALEAQELAKQNDIAMDPETGDVNPLRAYVNKSGQLITPSEKGDRVGTGKNLESVYEHIAPDLVTGISETPVSQDIVRPVGFEGNPADVVKEGLPKYQYAAAGFMPLNKAKGKIRNGDEPVREAGAGEASRLKFPAVRFTDKNGEVWRFYGRRHADAEAALVDALGYTPHYDKIEDGFMTEAGTFLDRESAYRRAVKTGQFSESKSAESTANGKLIAELMKGAPAFEWDSDGRMIRVGGRFMPGKTSEIRAKIEADGIDPERADKLPKFQHLVPFWIAPDGTLYDGHGSGERHHYAIAEKYIAPGSKTPMEDAHKAGWLRVNISPQDGFVMINEGKLTKEAKVTLEDLAFSQKLGVMDDSGREIIENPFPPEGDEGGSRSWFMPGEKNASSIESKMKNPVDKLWFYSGLRGVAAEKLPNRASKEQILATLDPAKSGIKKEELEVMGLPQFLEGKKNVTKQEVLDFIDANGVKLEETILGGKEGKDSADKASALREEYEHRRQALEEHIYEGNQRDWKDDEEAMEADSDYIFNEREELKSLYHSVREAESGADKAEPKFEQYSIKGGTNYRERLLTLPVKAGTAHTSGEFRSSHFDKPNIIVHTRESNHVDTEGKKVLVINEIQSDLHQTGKKEGYKGRKPYAEINSEKDLLDNGFTKKVNDQGATQWFDLTGRFIAGSADPDTAYREARPIAERVLNTSSWKAVPDFPFKKNWHELAFKRALAEAVKDGMDKIAWVKGETAADWFDLSKQVDSVKSYKNSDGTFAVQGIKDGQVLVSKADLDEKGLVETIGKELAHKIINGEGKDVSTDTAKKLGREDREFSGIDLKVGGEGMKGFYDKIIPDFVRKYVKPWGGKVEETRLAPMEETYSEYRKRIGSQHFPETEKDYQKEQAGQIVHSVTITPAMREAISAGQPLFMPGREGESASSIQSKMRNSDVDKLGFYSGLNRIIQAKIPNRASGEQILATLKGAGAKGEELDHLGLEEFLKSKGTITKQELSNFVKAGGVQLKEVVYSSGDERKERSVTHHDFTWTEKRLGDERFYENDPSADETVIIGRHPEDDSPFIIRKAREDDGVDSKYVLDGDWGDPLPVDSIQDAKDLAASYVEQNLNERDTEDEIDSGRVAGSTKYSGYTLPGGRNYKEVLLTLPGGKTKEQAIQERDALWSDIKKLEDFPHNEHVLYQGKWAEENAPELFNKWRDASRIANKKETESDTAFRSSHWDEPNVVAHIRQADHTDTQGDKVRLIEEFQSDWLQKAKEVGFAGEFTGPLPDYIKITPQEVTVADMGKFGESKKKLIYVVKKDGREIGSADTANEAEELARKSLKKLGVPYAPFKKSWQELLFKRALRMAVEDGMDKIAWTKGETQAERYDLSKQIDSIRASKNENGEYDIIAFKDGSPIIDETVSNDAKLSELIGKDLAKKIAQDHSSGPQDFDITNAVLVPQKFMSDRYFDLVEPGVGGRVIQEGIWLPKDETRESLQEYLRKKYQEEQSFEPPKKTKPTEYSGLDLKVGGEGMKGFYDKILPDFVRKYVKKWGGKVEEITLPNKDKQTDIPSFEEWAGPDTRRNQALREQYLAFVESEETKVDSIPVHSVEITPEMRKAVMEGQPMFMPGEAGEKPEENASSIQSKMRKGGPFAPPDRKDFLEIARQRATQAKTHEQQEQDRKQQQRQLEGLPHEALQAAIGATGGSGEKLSGELAEVGTSLQKRQLLKWAGDNGAIVKSIPEPDGGGSEHFTRKPDENGRIVKNTKEGRFGGIIDMENGGTIVRPATPLEYLDRIRIASQAFGDDVKFSGVNVGPSGLSIVTSQKYIKGEHPDISEAHKFMQDKGFVRVKPFEYYNPEINVAAYDVRGSNFIKDASGDLNPIDLMLSEPKGELKQLLEENAKKGYDGPIQDIGPKANFMPYETKDKKLMAIHNVSADKLLKSLELGGFAVPSVAILKKEGAGELGFGEITLVGDKSLIDPQQDARNRVFDADIYSVRHPQPIHDVDTKRVNALVKEFQDDRPDWYRLNDSPWDIKAWIRKGREGNREEAIQQAQRSKMLKVKFTEEKTGAKLEAKEVPAKLYDPGIIATKAMQEYLKSGEELPELFGNKDDEENQKRIKDFTAVVKAATGEEEDTRYRSSRYIDQDGGLLFGSANHILSDIQRVRNNRKEWSGEEAIKTADKYVYANQGEFFDWVESKINPLFNRAALKTRGGKVEYTLDNIVEAMSKRGPKGKEDALTKSLGMSRARSAKEFKTVDQIRAAQDKIVTGEEFDKAKEKSEKLFFKGTDLLSDNYEGRGFDLLDDASVAVGDYLVANKSSRQSPEIMRRMLRKNNFRGEIPETAVETMIQAAQALREMPTEYFEAKLHRAVGVQDFKGAVVPHKVSPKIVEKLKEAGLDVETHDGTRVDRSRAIEAVAKRNDSLFMPGEKSSSSIESKMQFDSKAGALSGKSASSIESKMGNSGAFSGRDEREKRGILAKP